MRYYGIQNEVKAYMNRLQSEQGISVPLSAVKTINDRVEALKKSGEWSRYSLGFNDVDADNYLARAGVTDVIGRSEICWFTRGIKSLGLWQNMVSWHMRSYQNAGTGSTVYSLGGLGIHNGTMVGSPVWNTNGSGIRFSAPTVRQYINIPTLTQSFNTDSSSFFAASVSSYVFVVPRLIGQVNAPASELTIWITSANKITRMNTWSESIDSVANINPNLDFLTFNTFGVSFNYALSSASYISNNTVTTVSRLPSNVTRNFQIAAGQQVSDHWNGDIAYGVRFNRNLTAAQMLAIKNLATKTIGNGLGLP